MGPEEWPLEESICMYVTICIICVCIYIYIYTHIYIYIYIYRERERYIDIYTYTYPLEKSFPEWQCVAPLVEAALGEARASRLDS